VQFLAKIRIRAILAKSPVRTCTPCGLLGGEKKGAGNFPYFFRHNPLKSPNSDE